MTTGTLADMERTPARSLPAQPATCCRRCQANPLAPGNPVNCEGCAARLAGEMERYERRIPDVLAQTARVDAEAKAGGARYVARMKELGR